MSFNVTFQYNGQPGYALDLKNAPDVSTARNHLENLTKITKQDPYFGILSN